MLETILLSKGDAKKAAKKVMIDLVARIQLHDGDFKYKKLGETDEYGRFDLHLDRKSLPCGLFFHPVGYNNKVKIYYKDIKDIMRDSEGTYNKRQFRLKMFTIQ